ncbi:RUN domain-containing protein 1-like [Littorina saxatilis]|uniref:RUN domain-containing protein n=1 Tax=Littorina saxatilis TaxID=31220 RepID=A0AAN9B495_9CAEN
MEEVETTAAEVSKLTIHQHKAPDSLPVGSHKLDFGSAAEETDGASVDYDSFDEQSYDRPAERWAPLGAAVSPTPSSAEPCPHTEVDRLLHMEEEQEQLNSSLLALTTHFAQVQFRLKQIVSAEPDDREILLKELEDFAFKGIPDVRGCHTQDAQMLQEMSDKEHEDKLNEQREKQRELIEQLKSQLEDLETYAYESGNAEELPTSKVMEKQKVMLEELHHKLDLNLDNFDKLNAEELKEIVDRAVGSIVNPAKVKEKVVEQLKTQIVDLERFIDFLQGEASSPGPLGKQRCTCPVHKGSDDSDGQDCCGSSKARSRQAKGKAPTHKPKDGEPTATSLMKKALTVMQIYVISQLGCGSREFKRNMLKKTTKGNHWGDLRAKLEVSITHTLEFAQQQQHEKKDWQANSSDSEEYTSDTDEAEQMSSPALTQCVRKELAMAVRDLMQHGLMEMGQSTSMVPLGCFPTRSGDVTRMMHAWDLLAKFYEMKHGREYNESPARMLSQSFHLDIVGGKPITAKQTLLGAIDTVLKSHVPHKRGEDSYFKAFICLALNERKLVTWLRLLFRTQTLIDTYYQDWSYVARTGFEDALQSLEKLLVINFRLPVDLAVRPFSNIRDAF